MRGDAANTFPCRGLALGAVLCLLVGVVGTSSAASLTTGKVKKIVKKQIKKLVPGMIDAATIDQGVIPTVTASVTDPDKPIFTTGPFTVSLDCSDDGGSVNLKLLVRTSEENSVANASSYISGDLDPADGDQKFQDYTRNPPGGEASANYPVNDQIFLRSPSGTYVWAQFDSATNFKGNHCYAAGWYLDLAGDRPTSPLALPGVSSDRSSLAAPLTAGKVKRIARGQIKKLVPGIIDRATIDQGILAPVTASVTDPNKTVLTEGPFTVSLDCSEVTGNVTLTLLARTNEENSVVNDAGTQIGGDLDPGDGDQVIRTYTGGPPGGDAVTGDPFDDHVSFRSPSGTHFEVMLDTVMSYQGGHCSVSGWFVSLTGRAPSGGSAAAFGSSRPALRAPLTTGGVKRVARRLIKNRVPKMIDAATFDQGTIPEVAASTTDPDKALFRPRPFTVTLDCSLDSGKVDLTLRARTTEENSLVNSGWGFYDEVDPSDGDVLFSRGDGNAPGGDAHVGSGLGYQQAVFHAPSGTHVYAQFDAVTNYQGNHCFVDGWFFDLAG